MDAPDLAIARQRIAAELAAQTGRLDLSCLQISDLPPEIKELDSLQTLDLSESQVRDLEPLMGLTSLMALNCFRTQVSDLRPLRGLSRLQTLDCSCTHVVDLETLRGLTSLIAFSCGWTKLIDNEDTEEHSNSEEWYVDLAGFNDKPKWGSIEINDLQPLRGLTSLRTLNCGNTRVIDLEPLRGLTSLQTLNCS
jgi:internalin A